MSQSCERAMLPVSYLLTFGLLIFNSIIFQKKMRKLSKTSTERTTWNSLDVKWKWAVYWSNHILDHCVTVYAALYETS